MKKLFILSAILLFAGSSVIAAEPESFVSEQKFNDNRGIVGVQKQPSTEKVQKQNVKGNWFCIVVQVNGKIDSVSRAVSDTKQ